MKNLDNYPIPLDLSWSTTEMVAVTQLVDAVFAAHETGIDREALLAKARAYRQILPTKSEQKQFERQIEQETGISIYQTIKAAEQTTKKQVKIDD